MKHEAFVYGWRNIETGEMYIGWHKNSDVDDGYTFSSKCPDFLLAWSLGLLDRCILGRGSAARMITLERCLLKSVGIKGARHSDKFYNKSNGGGAGILPISTITEEEQEVGLQWIKGIDPVESVDIFDLVDVELVNSIWENVKNSEYDTHEISVEEISNYTHNQVRLIMLDHTHVKNIAERMLHDTKNARENVSPIIVCVFKNGTRTIIDGNHTSQAVVKAGWTSAPVIFINSSDFLDKKSNIDKFGIIANYNPKIKKPNSTEDCQRAIINLYSSNLKTIDNDFKLLESEKFKATCIEVFYPQWTKAQISSNLNYACNRIKTEFAISEMNFQIYSKTELELIQKNSNFPENSAVITVTSGSVYNAGVGAIINKMGIMNLWKGTIITHHSGLNDYDNWSKSEKNLKDALKRVHPKCKVKVIILDPFNKTTSVEV